MKYIYIKNNLPQIYIEFDEPILEELNGNNLGTTYEDFLNGMWVLLNNEQVAFHSEYPNATV